MKSLFEEMGGTYRQEGDYLIPNLALPDEPEYQIGKYGRMRRSYLKEHRPVLYASLLTSGTLHRHLAEIDQACNERKPFFDFFFHLTFLLLNIPLHSEQQLPHRLQQSRPAVMPLCGHPPRQIHRGYWCGYSRLQEYSLTDQPQPAL